MLKINNISKQFDNFAALKNINVDVNDGEFIAILGPSGCGKTTLLRLIGGFMEPSFGEISLDGEILSSNSINVPVEKRNLGMVFQSFALWPHMTVKEHIEFPLESSRGKNLSPEQKNHMVQKAISAMGLSNLSSRLPGELSGGQRQRVALARAIVSTPKILLMDEPLSALDAELKVSMRKEIQDIHKMTKATILYVTHDQSEALAMADRIIIMKDGNVEQIGTPEEIYLHPKTKFVATFVSKCNLLKGLWQKGKFYPLGSDVIYNDNNIEKCFIESGLYPIRPEQFKLSKEINGIKGTIVNKQYNGREIHYTVESNNEFYTVYESDNCKFNVEDKINLVKKEQDFESIS